MIFEYGNEETDYLKRKDKKLGVYIDKIGKIQRAITPGLFAALIESIVSQQISDKAATTVKNRLSALSGMTPEGILILSDEQIQKCGMSLRKAGYIKNVATAAATGAIDFDKLPGMTDDEIVTSLTSIKGVGVWTAEMMLIFSLARPDVVSYLDLAIRRGMMKLYGLSDLPKDAFAKYRKRYSPFGTTASFYLWELSRLEVK